MDRLGKRRYSWGLIGLGVLPLGLAAALIFSVVVGSYFKGYGNGKKARDPEIVELKLELEGSRLAALAAEKRAEEAAQNVRIEYRTRTETIVKEAEARTELVEVIRREANPNCELPGAYRELWDGPPSPRSAEDKPSPRVNAAPVPLADAAEAAAEAKRRFHENEAKLIALQNYLSQIQEAPKP